MPGCGMPDGMGYGMDLVWQTPLAEFKQPHNLSETNLLREKVSCRSGVSSEISLGLSPFCVGVYLE